MQAISKKRIFSLILAAVIMLSLIPFSTLFTALAAPTITTTSLPDGMVGKAYSATLGASGTIGTSGTIGNSSTVSTSWAVSSGSLPSGLTLNSSTGSIAGTPTTAGTSTFSVTATDDDGASAPKSLSIMIAPAAVESITINKTTLSLATGATEQLTATILPSAAANTPITWATENKAVATVVGGLVTAVAPGTTNITATAGGKTAKCAVTVADNILKGKAYLHGSGGTTALGKAQIYGYADANYFYTETDNNGNYSIVLSGGQFPQNIEIIAHSNFILGRILLNRNGTGIQSGYMNIPGNEAKNGVDFYFTDPPKVTGRVLSSVDGPLEGAYVSVWDSVNTNKDGKFEAQSSIYSLGNQSVSASISAANHYYNYAYKTFNITVDSLKSGKALDLGDITLTKINQGGVFGDFSKNNLSLMPSTVSSGETSNATVNVYADQSAVLPGANIVVKADNGAVIRAESDSLVRVTANGKLVSPSQYTRTHSGSELTITIDLLPRTQYQVTFGIKAPDSLTATSYTAEASVNGTVIGKQTATIHNLNVNAPAEIGISDSFTIYGEVVSSDLVVLELSLISPTGEEIKFPKATTYLAGYFYKFKDLTLPPKTSGSYPFGEYTVKVKMLSAQDNSQIAEATTKMLISDKPVSVKSMLLQDSYNSVSVDNPTPGSFLTFVGWVDGSLWSMDYRNLKSEVKLNNADQVKSARFIMQTTHGKFSWPAAKSGDTFSAMLSRYQGTGKAAVSLEVIKNDGSIATYTIGNIVILIDPSGYVYDTATGEKIAGAKATLYYDIGNGWELWPADDFMQINPQYTDKEGKYGWMVPEGKYKVTVEKEGYTSYDTYETVSSPYKELNVLPEQKDINIGLTPIAGNNPPPYSSSGGSSGGGDSGPLFSSSNSAAAPATTWLTADNIKGSSRSSGMFGVRASAFSKLKSSSYYHDSTVNGAVMVRVSIDNPSLIKRDTLLSAYVSGANVNKTLKYFTKWFTNKLQIIHFDQQTDWDSPVKVASKVNISSMDVNKLCFYSYDKKTNRSRRIENPNYRIDTNGFLHFTTPYAGGIIVSEGPLTKK